MLRRIVGIIYTPESDRTPLVCFMMHVYTLFLWISFIARYGEKWANLYAVSLVFDVPEQLEEAALAIAEEEEGVFAKNKRTVGSCSNGQRKLYNKTIDVRESMAQQRAEKLKAPPKKKDSTTHGKMKKLIDKIIPMNLDTRNIEEWETIKPVVTHFVEKWEQDEQYSSLIHRIEGDHFLLMTGGEVRYCFGFYAVLISFPESKCLSSLQNSTHPDGGISQHC